MEIAKERKVARVAFYLDKSSFFASWFRFDFSFFPRERKLGKSWRATVKTETRFRNRSLRSLFRSLSSMDPASIALIVERKVDEAAYSSTRKLDAISRFDERMIEVIRSTISK